MINPVCCINHNLILHVYIRARFIWLKGQNILQQRSSLLIGFTSILRGLWDEIFWPSKPRTTEEPRTGEGHRKVDIWTRFKLQQVIWWP